jgi:hypothetical protein
MDHQIAVHIQGPSEQKRYATERAKIFSIIIMAMAVGSGAYWPQSLYRWGDEQDIINQAQRDPSQYKPSLLKFSGKVLRGQFFEKKIGQNLIFRLIPTQYGWYISVVSKTNPANDLSGVATPPFRGINHLMIDGWHFRNADNSGPNEIGPKNVNAPQHVREFYFVLNETDYKKASEALERMMWPYAYSKDELEEARKIYGQIKTAKGVLAIKDMGLGNLVVGEKAWIVYMKFQVELYLPPASPSFPMRTEGKSSDG